MVRRGRQPPARGVTIDAVDRAVLRDRILDEARRQGFVTAGVAGLRPFRQARRRALRAIDEGRTEGMPWFSRERVEISSDPRGRYPWARSALALAWPYRPASPGTSAAEPGRPRGRFSAYACLDAGDGPGATPEDYHDVLARACDRLRDRIGELAGPVRSKRFIDHGWALDRPLAERAGLGFAGKNACLITPQAGSYVLLAGMLLSLPLPPSPLSRRGCGGCRACIPSCPTGAIVAPGVIDATRCISYLTIEHRGPIPLPLRPLMGTWAFGCDLCQEACPINSRLAPKPLPTGKATTAEGPVPFPDLVECLELDDAEFSRRFRATAVWRTGRDGLARNAAIALGNAGDVAAIPALQRAHDSDRDPVVREAAGWALSRLRAGYARASTTGDALSASAFSRSS
jgi:epoxyqueuosine reductase